MTSTAIDEAHMRAALALARRGPVPDPNPRVGCVLVADGRVIGEGYHRGSGTPHAEVAALSAAGGQSTVGATAYVTLEPCAHHGRTGPCAEALIAAGVVRVVYAQADPNPDASGGGALLRRHGVQVEDGLLADDAVAVNRAWTIAMRRGRPMVTWKVAGTLDGYAAAADRTSRWITGAKAREDVHRLRGEVGAVMVGTGTVLADDPALTVRLPGHDGPQPLRVVIGRTALPPQSRVLDASAPHLVITEHDPDGALKTLWSRRIRHVLLEGGPTLAAAFLRAGLVDEVVAYIAPKVLGEGLAVLGSLGVGTIADAATMELLDVRRLGDDVRLVLRPKTGRGQ